jgi:hypothetical protein
MLQYSPKIITDSLVMCLDASNNKSYPTDLPVKNGLALWLDAADDTTFSYSSGTSVSQWRDKSGNNRHFFQATANNQPSRSAVINSRKAIQFTAVSGQYLRYNSTIINNTTGGSVFVVWRTAGETNAYSSILDNYHCGNSALNAGFQIERNVTNNQYGWGFITTGCANGGTIPATSYSNDTTNCIWITKDSTTITGGLNGTSVNPDASPSATWVEDTKGWTIGAWGSGTETFGRFFNGQQCEVIIFNRGLSSTERKQVNTYLGQKWGISNTDRSAINLAGGFTSPWLLGVGDGATNNMPTYSPYNKTFVFDGTNDIISYPNALGTFASYTFSFWARRNVESKMAFSSYGDAAFYWFGDNSWAYTHGGVFGEKYYNKAVSIPLGSYGHYCVTYDGAAVRIYRNGIFEDSQATTGSAVFNVGLQLGRFGADPTSYAFSGDIANFLMYTRALSAAEVQQNYESQKARFANYIVTSGLVLNLDAGNPYSYAGAGTTWYDVSGNSNNGTLTNGPTYSSDVGGIIVFDGVDDYVNVSNPASLNPGSNSFTIDAWVYQKDAGYNGVVDARAASFHGFLLLLNYTSAGVAAFFLNTINDVDQNVYYSTIATFADVLAWMNVNVVINRSANNITFYKNGIQQGDIVTITSGGSVDPGSGYLYYVGGDLGGPEANINLSTIKQYNRALSGQEVLQNYNATKGRFGL